jgi:hypothetical protein
MQVDVLSGQPHGESTSRSIWRPEDQTAHVLVSILLYARIALILFGMALIDVVGRRIRRFCNALLTV